jgi:3-oxoadipate enol-lactonase
MASRRFPGVFIEGDASKPTLVLLHSIATSSQIWKPLTSLYTSAFHVVCIDIPGHGDAPRLRVAADMKHYADYVHEVLETLRLRPQAMLGISLGGMIAQAFAATSESLQAVVLANCSNYTPEPVKRLWDQRLASAERSGMEGQVEATLERWFTPGFSSRSPLCMRWISSLISNTSIEGYADAIRAIQALDHRQSLKSLELPVLAVAGLHDLAVPVSVVENMVEGLPRGQLLTLADSAHLSCVETPIAFAEKTAEFLLEVLS